MCHAVPVMIWWSQYSIQLFDLRLEFRFDDSELEAGLQQREYILDVVLPTGDRFEQEDVSFKATERRID